MGRRPLPLLAAVLAAGALAGPAATAPRAQATDANVWVTSVCTSLTTWQHSLVSRPKAIAATKPASLAILHDRFASFLQAVVADTDTLIERTEAAGTPSVAHGADVSRALVTGFSKLRAYFALDAAKAKRLSKTDAKAFSSGASALGAAIDRQATQVGKTFDALDKKYRSSQLDRAMKSAKACRSIN